jgi:OOP family OmpA-OmpF porin
MKKRLLILALIWAAGTAAIRAQISTDSWVAGAGLSYPRYASVNIDTLNSDLGGYLSIQRNMTEHLGLRLKAGFSHMEGQYYNESASLINESTNLITADLDVLFYPVPCDSVSPYIFGGVGGNYKMISNAQTAVPDADKAGAQLNFGAGIDFKVAQDLNLVTEFGYHITDDSSLDGAIVPAEINAQDSYFAFTVGINYIFDSGTPSKLCEPCAAGVSQAMKDRVIYNSKVVDRYILSLADDKLVLVGVNFDFDSSELTPESYPVIDKAVKMMNDKPKMKIEIAGYTDYEGGTNYNLELARDRAARVRDYMISKGIDGARLTIISFGKGRPSYDNKTADGRDLNRKIMFRIIK